MKKIIPTPLTVTLGSDWLIVEADGLIAVKFEVSRVKKRLFHLPSRIHISASHFQDNQIMLSSLYLCEQATDPSVLLDYLINRKL